MGRTQVSESMLAANGRAATVVVAPQDNPRRSSADVKLTGTNDHLELMDIMDFYRGTPLRILGLAGAVGFNGKCVIDTSWVTIEGESHGFWNRYTGPGSGEGYQNFPRSAPGEVDNACGFQIQQNSPGQDLFGIGTNYFDGDNRHKDIVFSRLAMWGPSGTGMAIRDSEISDFCKIEDCFFSGFAAAIDVAWDHAIVRRNNIQDIGGSPGTPAVRMRGFRGEYSGNCVFQVSGDGARFGAPGMIVSENFFGATNGHAVQITSADIIFDANHVRAWGLGDVDGDYCGIITANYQSGNKSDLPARSGVISNNKIKKTGDYLNDPLNGVGSGTGDGLRMGAGNDGSPSGGNVSKSDYWAVTGNAFDTEQSASGKAINLLNGSDYNAIGLNTIRGPWNNGTNNGKIARGSGSNNKFRGNTGDGTAD